MERVHIDTLRIGMIGLDTSHVTAFANLLHDSAHTHHVPGGRIVAAFPGGSEQLGRSRERIDQFTSRLRDDHGVVMVDSIEALATDVDAVMLESVDGRQHLEQFRVVAPHGKPVFIDKPIATSVHEAQAILDLAAQHRTPVFSSSSIRYAGGLSDLGAGETVLGVQVYGPNPTLPDFPRFFWYGIHCAEVLFSKMGTGCASVSCTSTDQVDLMVGTWTDGRVGTVYGHRHPELRQWGATLLCEGGPLQGTAGGSPPSYAGLLQQIMRFFQTGESPVEPAESLEVVAFLEAADRSRDEGRPVELQRT